LHGNTKFTECTTQEQLMSVQTMPLEGIRSAPQQTPLTQRDLAVVDRITGWNVGIGIAALTIGLALGVL
jgi:hypothetical protein